MSKAQLPHKPSLDTKIKWLLSCLASFSLGFGMCYVWWQYEHAKYVTFKSAADAIEGKSSIPFPGQKAAQLK